jgi:hypothetical protein
MAISCSHSTADCCSHFNVLFFIGGGSFDEFLKRIGGKLTSGAFDLVLKELGLEVKLFFHFNFFI